MNVTDHIVDLIIPDAEGGDPCFHVRDLEPDILLEVLLRGDELIDVDGVGEVKVLQEMVDGLDVLLELRVLLLKGFNLLLEL